MKNRLAIFDMDGTLFDTVEANYEAYKNAVMEVIGSCSIGLEEFKNKCFGKNYKYFLREIFNVNEALIEDIHDLKCLRYMKYAKKYVKENTFLFYVINEIKEKYYIALLTTASAKNTYEILKAYNKTEIFDLILTSDDVENLKPDSEGILRAMNYFDVDACKTIFFDDSEDCVNMARDLGIDSYKIIAGR